MKCKRNAGEVQPPTLPTVLKSQKDQEFEERNRIAEDIVRALRKAGYACDLGIDGARTLLRRGDLNRFRHSTATQSAMGHKHVRPQPRRGGGFRISSHNATSMADALKSCLVGFDTPETDHLIGCIEKALRA